MQRFDRNSKRRAEAETAPLDPIALTLALWLGLVVGVTGLIRLSEAAAANAARMQNQQPRAAVTMLRPMAFAPYGS
jgi:hypothetical protein